MKNVLIESRKKERAISPQWPAESESELLLLVVRLELEECLLGRKFTIANEVEPRSVNVIRS